MYRHSPVRSQRSKGFKIKHVLQVCLMVAICFWLIFQVKRSHDKKKGFDMKTPSSTRTQSSDEMVRFGRKDLKPKLVETDKELDMHEEGQEHEHDEEEEQEHDEEDEIEEEKDDGGGGGGDDEIDENEQEKSDLEIDREEIDEDKENEEKDETEIWVSSDDNDDEDGTMAHNHEAREEHYKADDASSAVTHDARTLGSENENGNGISDNSIDNIVPVDNGESVKNGQEKGSESMVISMNGTTLIDSHENKPPSSTTETTSDSTRAQIITERAIVSVEQAGNSTIDTSISYQVATIQEPSNLTNISDVLESHESRTEDKGTETLKTEVESNAGEGESKIDELVERSDPDKLRHDTIGSSDQLGLEEKEVGTGVGMLPEIEREGGNSEDTAAE